MGDRRYCVNGGRVRSLERSLEQSDLIEGVMKPQKWNTGQLAIYGVFGGLAVGIIRAWPIMIQEGITGSLVYLVGSALAGAALLGLVSGIRNLFIR